MNLRIWNSASILIWTMFVSLFIVSFFVSIQQGFIRYINNSNNQKIDFQNTLFINKTIDEIKNWTFSWIIKNENVLIQSQNYTNSFYTFGLKFNKNIDFLITSSWWSNWIDVINNNSWIIFYEVISFNSWSASSAIVSSSWLIKDNFINNINIDWNKDFNIIWFKNIWLDSDLIINPNNTNIKPRYSVYEVYEYIGGYKKYIKSFYIEFYNLWQLLWLDYKKFEVFN